MKSICTPGTFLFLGGIASGALFFTGDKISSLGNQGGGNGLAYFEYKVNGAEGFDSTELSASSHNDVNWASAWTGLPGSHARVKRTYFYTIDQATSTSSPSFSLTGSTPSYGDTVFPFTQSYTTNSSLVWTAGPELLYRLEGVEYSMGSPAVHSKYIVQWRQTTYEFGNYVPGPGNNTGGGTGGGTGGSTGGGGGTYVWVSAGTKYFIEGRRFQVTSVAEALKAASVTSRLSFVGPYETKVNPDPNRSSGYVSYPNYKYKGGLFVGDAENISHGNRKDKTGKAKILLHASEAVQQGGSLILAGGGIFQFGSADGHLGGMDLKLSAARADDPFINVLGTTTGEVKWNTAFGAGAYDYSFNPTLTVQNVQEWVFYTTYRSSMPSIPGTEYSLNRLVIDRAAGTMWKYFVGPAYSENTASGGTSYSRRVPTALSLTKGTENAAFIAMVTPGAQGGSPTVILQGEQGFINNLLNLDNLIESMGLPQP